MSLAENKKARHDYQIEETIEAGVLLTGSETKSIKSGGSIQFADSYVKPIRSELYLVNCSIARLKQANILNHEETRTRKLLLHKLEILKLSQKCEEKGLTLVPLKFYLKGPWIKLLIGLAKGRKTFEKRDELKKKNVARELARDFKSSQLKIR